MDTDGAFIFKKDLISSLKRPRSRSNSEDVISNLSRKQRLTRASTVIKIVSATYEPAPGHRLLTGEPSNNKAACIPYNRNVTPFVKALLIAREHGDTSETQEEGSHTTASDFLTEIDDIMEEDLVRIARKRNLIPLMDGRSMNAVFGDPCPGVSKRLNIHYIIYDFLNDAASKQHKASEVHRQKFAEHERVILTRQVTFFQSEDTVAAAAERLAKATVSGQDEQKALLRARRMGRAQSVADFAQTALQVDPKSVVQSSSAIHPLKKRGDCKKWRLRSATSEIVLPIVLPFLEVRERVQCQLVCVVWRFVVRQWGVAQTVDINDEHSFPNFTRPFIRGILAHSHHSLQSLFLSGFADLSKDDLHPAIPHLRKLRSLDVSRCAQLDDSTLLLISEHVNSTLEVLYLKGLRKVTDQGISSICTSCLDLRVLEISDIPITDASGRMIGDNLAKLQALYMRDNYLLTNQSVDVITQKCTKLSQLTLWGTIRLRHLSFETGDRSDLGCRNLVILNLWGCYGLLDEAANSLVAMKNLRSLIVSECHRLTDNFLFLVSKQVPQLNHFHLRYCKKITNNGITAVSETMVNLYSLDLSFCTRLGANCIAKLLQDRKETLTELRLQNCTQLDISQDRRRLDFAGIRGDGQAGRDILAALRREGDNCFLSMLDLRNCGGVIGTAGYPDDDPFVRGARTLGFIQKLPGLFVRPLRWSSVVQQQLVDQLVADSASTK